MAHHQRRLSVLVGNVVGSLESDEIKRQYTATSEHVWVEKPKKGTVAVVGAPLCDGQPLGGVDLGPDALRKAGLQKAIEDIGWSFQDHGDTSTAVSPKDKNDCRQVKPGAVYFDEGYVMNSRSCGICVERIYQKVAAAAAPGNFVLTIGGDHSIASGSIQAMRAKYPDLAVVWVDAHGDCNTPLTSPSKHYHGMPLAHVVGWFEKSVPGFEWSEEFQARNGVLNEERVALIGLRDVDKEERELLRNSGVHVFSMTDVDRSGIGQVLEQALEKIDPKQKRPIHLSFDIDSCDPSIAPGTGTQSRGGLSYREAHYICERLASTHRVVSMDLVEINPKFDKQTDANLHGDNPLIAGGETVRLGIELVTSALGKTIV